MDTLTSKVTYYSKHYLGTILYSYSCFYESYLQLVTFKLVLICLHFEIMYVKLNHLCKHEEPLRRFHQRSTQNGMLLLQTVTSVVLDIFLD